MAPELADDERFRERFLTGVAAGSSADHPNEARPELSQ